MNVIGVLQVEIKRRKLYYNSILKYATNATNGKYKDKYKILKYHNRFVSSISSMSSPLLIWGLKTKTKE